MINTNIFRLASNKSSCSAFERTASPCIPTLCSFMLPIIISCVIYLVLICKKRNNFENKIESFFGEKPLHAVSASFLQSQCSNSSRENVSRGELAGINDQEHNEEPITLNKNITSQRDFSTKKQGELQTSIATNPVNVVSTEFNSKLQIENNSNKTDIRPVNRSPNQKVDDNEDRSAADNLQYPHNRFHQ